MLGKPPEDQKFEKEAVFFFFKKFYLFMYLAVSGLSCSIQNLHCIMQDLSLRSTGLVTLQHVGS